MHGMQFNHGAEFPDRLIGLQMTSDRINHENGDE